MRRVGAGLVMTLSGLALAIFLTAAAYMAVSRTAPDAATPAGSIDRKAMSEATLRQFAGQGHRTLAGAFSLAGDYRRSMANDLAGVQKDDPNGSSPLLWPLARKPIVYRWDSDGQSTAYLVLAPNLVGWLISLAGVIAALGMLYRTGRPAPGIGLNGDTVLSVGFAGTWLAFLIADLVLASARVMYLYHFLPNLILGFAAAGLAGGTISARSRARLAAAILPLLLSMFLLSAPLIFHHQISKDGCRLRRTVGLGPECR